jgi:hypothetical protein
MVFLYGIEDTSTAVGIAVAVDKAAHGSCILKLIFVVIGHQLGLASGYLWVGIHILYQRLKPSWGNLHIGVEQYGILGIDGFESFVVAIGKTIVLVEGYSTHRRKRVSQELERMVGRAIVGYVYLCFAQRFGQYRMGYYRGKEIAEHVLAVPVEDYYCYFHDSFGCRVYGLEFRV